MPALGELVPNTPAKRFDYVVRTYRDTPRALVIFDVATFAASLFGLDRLMPQIFRLRTRYVEATGREAPEPSPFEDLPAAPGQHPASARAWSTTPGAHGDAAADLAIGELVAVMDVELPEGPHRFDFLLPWAAARLSKLLKRVQRAEKVRAEDAAPEQLARQQYLVARDKLRQFATAIGQFASQPGVDINRYSIEQAVEEAKQIEHVAPVDRAQVVWKFDDGYTVQKLTTKQELDDEGEAMGHCVGSYCAQVRRGDTQIYSLRDSNDRPHVTLEFDNDELRWEQIRGKQNAKPVEKYWPYLEEFIKGYTPEGAEEPDEGGLRFFGGPGPMLEALRDHPELEAFAYSGGYHDDDDRLQEGQSINHSQLSPLTDPDQWDGDAVVMVPYTTYGDNVGSFTNKCNAWAFLRDHDNHPDVHEVYGALGSNAVAVNLRSGDEELAETVVSMLNDVVYCEDTVEFEQQQEDEDWENWAGYEFERALEKEATYEDAEEAMEEVASWLSDTVSYHADTVDGDSMLRDAFELMRREEDVYWEEEGGQSGRIIRIDDVLKADPRNLGLPLLGSIDTMAEHRSASLSVLVDLRRALSDTLGVNTLSSEQLGPVVALLQDTCNVQLALDFGQIDDVALLAQAGVSESQLDAWAERLELDPPMQARFCELADAWLVTASFHNALMDAEPEYDDVALLIAESKPAIEGVWDTVRELRPLSEEPEEP